MNQNIPDHDEHIRPKGVSDQTVKALGTLSEALEQIERARGHLYEFHQITGAADIAISKAADELAQAGHSEQADMLKGQIVGLNVLAGRWTFQIVEEYDDGHYAAVKSAEAAIRGQLVNGKRHIYESEMKEANRSHVTPGHEARP